MYRITYEQGNGYHCGCCRRTSTETHDVETTEEVQNWINQLHASFKSPVYEDEDDRDLISIEKEIGVDIQDQFPANQEVVDAIIAERQKAKEVKKKREEDDKTQREYQKFLELQEKFKNN
jgi:hypothetical protein